MGNKPIKPFDFDEKSKDMEKFNTITLEEVLSYNTVLYDSDLLPFNIRLIKRCVIGQRHFLFIVVLESGEIFATRHIGCRKLDENDRIQAQNQQINGEFYSSNEEVNEFLILRRNEKFPTNGNKASSAYDQLHINFNDNCIGFSSGISVSLYQVEKQSPSFTYGSYGIETYYLHGNHSNFKGNAYNQPITRLIIIQLHSEN